MRCIVRRYVTSEQRKSENTNITEDDINEVISMHTLYESTTLVYRSILELL